MKTIETPELLMPAGSLEKLKTAFSFGADAVYAGVPFFSLRARENEFNLEDLQEGIELANSQDRKLYLTANIFARNSKIKSFIKHIDAWAQLKPHALIMSDPGLISIVKERHPDIPIHLSVQANCMNWSSVKFWHSIGVERIILSRELRLEEVKEIKNQVPEMELEAFVHGSICIAYSGRCLLSHYMSHRDANQGVCDNSCRYDYNLYKTEKKEEDYYLEDLRNKGELYRINEDENGTYIMNAKDLRLIQYLKEITDAGVCSFKIEGRTKSLYYLSMVTKAYRKAIDDMAMGKDFNPELITELDKVPNRGYHEGFMVQQVGSHSQNYDNSVSRYHTQSYAGRVVSPVQTNANRIHIEVRNKLTRGQEIEVISPDDKTSKSFTIGNMYNADGEVVESVHGGTGVFEFEMDFIPEEYSILSLKPKYKTLEP
ncbi:MAG: hypothetical protein HOO06_15695 [Bdellovibrionaceae bacterium]|mgnify:CR=1 FL=1|jgi:U32 family peptidase|nr:hypothetical protein [Pseudobdellovibrionaceae bacterium]